MIVLRLLHIVLGALWVGIAVFLPLYLMPSLGESGPDAAARVMSGLQKRKMHIHLPIAAILTLLTGYMLYWKASAGFQPEFMGSAPGIAFGTGGLLWASLTLALLTVPVVIVATEEALAAVPRSVREGSLACGASKWQTIRRIVLPQALPGIMTGLILAMARGAGEVAPLMLVGVVKLAPELPVDGVFPFLHFERSFMHLGFHIYDVGFQSRNSEAGKPMVYVTTLLLITLIALMNATAIFVRARLKRRFAGSQF